MDDPVKELPLLVKNALGTVKPQIQRETLERVFCEHSEFVHPVIHILPGPGSKERIIQAYRCWKGLTWEDIPEVQEIWFDAGLSKAMMKLTQTVRPIHMPLIQVEIRLTVLLDFDKSFGKYRIKKQEDFVPFEDLVNILLPGSGFLIERAKRLGSYMGAAFGIAMYCVGWW
ncbi:hypothetical protein K493DRAFT_342371 [Basidiobolus meristosporus CBS 931.73]|uniref:SigF-like NTF2-like domain-containing protein n=1 Tax=Basidiobolus meristosporus CBS 931.73 TaxID=1314790 RepID=A0A1Y1X6P7_9FUNG|nr:hypothetical protein K493DRAFT_342371 [Basidiobolus meristosporus CBS 931.73]|eukprot:ORX81461.1 hypothetical protein K493DRAFT_342371 [Basidiobolus meristosporus CBS 931.73]